MGMLLTGEKINFFIPLISQYLLSNKGSFSHKLNYLGVNWSYENTTPTLIDDSYVRS